MYAKYCLALCECNFLLWAVLFIALVALLLHSDSSKEVMKSHKSWLVKQTQSLKHGWSIFNSTSWKKQNFKTKKWNWAFFLTCHLHVLIISNTLFLVGSFRSELRRNTSRLETFLAFLTSFKNILLHIMFCNRSRLQAHIIYIQRWFFYKQPQKLDYICN